MDYVSYRSKNETKYVARMGQMRVAHRVLAENLTKEATWKT